MRKINNEKSNKIRQFAASRNCWPVLMMGEWLVGPVIAIEFSVCRCPWWPVTRETAQWKNRPRNESNAFPRTDYFLCWRRTGRLSATLVSLTTASLLFTTNRIISYHFACFDFCDATLAPPANHPRQNPRNSKISFCTHFANNLHTLYGSKVVSTYSSLNLWNLNFFQARGTTDRHCQPGSTTRLLLTTLPLLSRLLSGLSNIVEIIAFSYPSYRFYGQTIRTQVFPLTACQRSFVFFLFLKRFSLYSFTWEHQILQP